MQKFDGCFIEPTYPSVKFSSGQACRVTPLALAGGTGTGKTHLATALGVAGIQHHSKRVRFFSTVELVNSLEQENATGKQGQLALSLMQMDLVIS